MSYIATLEGILRYESAQDMDEAIDFLKDHDFHKAVTIDLEANVIRFPQRTYRNLGRHLDPLLETADSGYVISVSNEVRWHGCVELADGTSKEYDLEEWSKANDDAWADEYDSHTPPNPDDPEEYATWQAAVEDAFRAVMTDKYDLNRRRLQATSA